MNDAQQRMLYRALLLAAAACFVMLLFVVREWTAVSLLLWVGGLVAAQVSTSALAARRKARGNRGGRHDSETQGRRRGDSGELGLDAGGRGRAYRPARQRGSSELVQQRLGVLQVGGVEAFGEPVVNGGEDLARLIASSLVAKQAGQARRGAQLVGLRLSLLSELLPLIPN